MSKFAYVIQANDSVEAVVLGTETDADNVRDRLKAAYEASHREMNGPTARMPLIFWAVRETPIHAPLACPFDGDNDLEPTDPCPICGDLGTFDAEESGLCIAVGVAS